MHPRNRQLFVRIVLMICPLFSVNGQLFVSSQRTIHQEAEPLERGSRSLAMSFTGKTRSMPADPVNVVGNSKFLRCRMLSRLWQQQTKPVLYAG